MKILICFGTRPEAIKMAPIIKELQVRNLAYKICVTAQHREMLDQVLEFFSIHVDHDLNLMQENQDLNKLSARIIENIDDILLVEKPNIVLVQGDTTTAFVVAMAAFNRGVKVGHVEAGLRTNNLKSPFPEEGNRQLISRISSYNFVPTVNAQNNLLQENTQADRIFLTGNTVVDAVEYVRKKLDGGYKNEEILSLKKLILPNRKVILVTGHRRENFDHGLDQVCEALIKLSKREDVQIIFPVHPNPKLKNIIYGKLNNIKNIDLIKPLSYPALLWLMKKSLFIISDSGGIQEEAPGFNKRVLITRETTERMEAVNQGFHILTKNKADIIENESLKILKNPLNFEKVENPFGDGQAAKKIIDIIQKISF